MSEGRFCARRERKVKRAGKSVDGKVKCVQVSRSLAVQEKSVVPFQRAPRQSALSDRRRILMGEHTKETAEGKKFGHFVHAWNCEVLLLWCCQQAVRAKFFRNSCKVSGIFLLER